MDITALSNQQLLTLIIALALGGLVFGGVFVAALVSYIRRRTKASSSTVSAQLERSQRVVEGGSKDTMGSLLKSSGKKSDLSSSKPRTEMDLKQRTETGSILSPSSKEEEYQELLRILVNSTTNEVIVEVDGQRFSSISQVKQRSIGQRILEGAAVLLKFTGGLIATATGTKTLPAPEVKLTSLPKKSKPSPLPAPEPAPPVHQPVEPPSAGQQFLSQMEAQTQARTAPTPKEIEEKSRWSFGFGRSSKKEEETPLVPMFNLAEQIDEILQEKLLQANEQTPVKIHSGAGGQIRIQVGNKFYSSVDEVQEQRIGAIIKSAVQEWERR
jgi:hypothetical protein